MKQIPGYPGYSITRDGKVWSHIGKGRWLKPQINSGRLTVGLRVKGKRYTRHIHRLLLEAFVGPRLAGMECRHLDGNPLNNNLDNICWGTKSENQMDRARHGTSNRGERSASVKLTESIVILIRQLWNIRWMGIKQWELGDMFNVSRSTVEDVVCWKTWRHVEEKQYVRTLVQGL